MIVSWFPVYRMYFSSFLLALKGRVATLHGSDLAYGPEFVRHWCTVYGTFWWLYYLDLMMLECAAHWSCCFPFIYWKLYYPVTSLLWYNLLLQHLQCAYMYSLNSCVLHFIISFLFYAFKYNRRCLNDFWMQIAALYLSLHYFLLLNISDILILHDNNYDIC